MVELSVVNSGGDDAAGKSESLSSYVDYLYGGLEGYVSGALKWTAGEEVKFRRESFEWPQDRNGLIEWIKGHSSTKDVYLAPAIFAQPGGRREDFKATNVLWTEFDGTLPSTEQRGEIPEPTLRVRSSSESNEHWYWRLDTPLTDSSRVEALNRALTYQLGADASSWDANQVLRPPATHNHKRDKEVVLLSRSESTVTPVQFEVLPEVAAPVVDLQPSVIPDVADVVLKYAWPEEVAELYRAKADGADRSGMLMKLGYYLAEMGMSDAEMFSVLRNADDRWGKFKDRTDRERRLADLISKARAKYPSEIVLGENTVPIFGTLSFLNTEIEISWIIEGLLQEQGYMLLTGPAGVGKTQFSLRWAINLALGRSFLGLEVVRPCRILFWSLEMGHADLKYFLSTMCQGMTQEELLLLEQNLLIAPLGEAFYLDKPEQQLQFIQILDEFKPDGVMVDSVGSSSSGNVSDEATVKAMMDFNDRIRQKHSVFTWFIHHNRKAQGENKKPNKLADVYGNQYLVNRATSVYCLWPNGNNIEVLPLKKRLAKMEDPWQINRFGNLDFVKKETTVTFATPSTFSVESEDAGPSLPGVSGFADI